MLRSEAVGGGPGRPLDGPLEGNRQPWQWQVGGVKDDLGEVPKTTRALPMTLLGIDNLGNGWSRASITEHALRSNKQESQICVFVFRQTCVSLHLWMCKAVGDGGKNIGFGVKGWTTPEPHKSPWFVLNFDLGARDESEAHNYFHEIFCEILNTGRPTLGHRQPHATSAQELPSHSHIRWTWLCGS